MTNNRTEKTASQNAFAKYTRHISEKFLEKYGRSYQTQANTRNAWRQQTPYSQEIENFLIFETKMFIRFLDERDPNSTNLQFLSALINLIADYLSDYTAKNPEYMTRKKAKEYMRRALFDQSSYIQHLKIRQQIKAAAKAMKQRRNNRQTNNGKDKKAQVTKQRINQAPTIQLQIIETIIVRKK